MPDQDGDEEKQPSWATSLRAQQARLNEQQRRIATSIADLALALNEGERRARDRHAELLGIALAAAGDQHRRALPAGGEDSLEIALGEPGASLRLPRRRLFAYGRMVLKWLWYLLVLGAAGAGYVKEWLGSRGR